jgi:hypothetical protein
MKGKSLLNGFALLSLLFLKRHKEIEISNKL